MPGQSRKFGVPGGRHSRVALPSRKHLARIKYVLCMAYFSTSAMRKWPPVYLLFHVPPWNINRSFTLGVRNKPRTLRQVSVYSFLFPCFVVFSSWQALHVVTVANDPDNYRHSLLARVWTVSRFPREPPDTFEGIFSGKWCLVAGTPFRLFAGLMFWSSFILVFTIFSP